MSNAPSSVSDHLRILQTKIGSKVLTDGCVRMDRTESRIFLHQITKSLEAAKALENAYSQAEWNSQAYFDMLVMQLGEAKAVLDLFKPDDLPSNVIPLHPRQPEPPVPTGGDAA